jgi:DNA-binding PadR family transcriptional regulator
MLKGILDGCVLRVIASGEVYGYELIQKLKMLVLKVSSVAQFIRFCRNWRKW